MPLLKDEHKKILLSLDRDNITVPVIAKLFGKTTDAETRQIKDPIIPRKHTMQLKAGEYTNKTDIITRPGIFLFNKLLIEGRLEHIIENGYYNEIMTSDKMNALLSIIANALINKKIEIDPHLLGFMKWYEFYGLKPTAIFCPSYTMKTVMPLPSVMKEKERLLSECKDLSNLKNMVDIETKLVNMAKKELDGDPGMSIYESGSRGDFANDYKINSIMGGAMLNVATGEYELMTSNYVDGIKKEDIPKAGNSVVAAAYPKAVGTASGGYATKQFYSVFQSLKIGEDGTDCGSKGYLEVFLTDRNVNSYLYQNIIEGDRLVNLTSENKNKYLNKTVKMRSPMFCTSEDYCHACAGDRPSRIGIKNIGLTTPRIPNNLMEKQMKRFHNTKVKLFKVDVNKLLI